NGPNIWAMQQYASQQDYYGKSLIDSVNTEQPFAAGLRVFDISKPANPREIAFLDMPGFGAHRIWWVGGRYAYVSVHFEGFIDHALAVIDVSDPTKPTLAGRWWLPGMNRAGGETPPASFGKRTALHHLISAGNLGFAAWRDGGFTIHDISDPPNPKLISHRNFAPPFGGGAHTTLPTPAEEDFCAKGAKFGPHNLHENRPGSMQTEDLIFATYHNAGLRIYDIRDAFQPKQIGYFVPPAPEKTVDQRPNPAKVIQSCDVYVDKEGLMYLTDTNAGLYILQYEGH